MWQWLAGVVVLAGVFVLLYRLLAKTQAGDPNQRGRNSSSPGGYYSETGSGGGEF